ncbi:hypothetical protein SprV_0200543500 [Sparganum proliferum]
MMMICFIVQDNYLVGQHHHEYYKRTNRSRSPVNLCRRLHIGKFRHLRQCLLPNLRVASKRRIRQLAVVGGRSEKDFVRNLLTALLGPPLCYTFCWRGGSKEKRSFLACPLYSILNGRSTFCLLAHTDAIGQNLHFSNCNREVIVLTAINWFHGSKDRYGGRSSRRRNVHKFQGVPTDDLASPQLSPPKHTNRR